MCYLDVGRLIKKILIIQSNYYTVGLHLEPGILIIVPVENKKFLKKRNSK